MKLVSLELSLEGRERIQADVTVYPKAQKLEPAGAGGVWNSLEQQGEERQERHIFHLELVCGPEFRL